MRVRMLIVHVGGGKYVLCRYYCAVFVSAQSEGSFACHVLAWVWFALCRDSTLKGVSCA